MFTLPVGMKLHVVAAAAPARASHVSGHESAYLLQRLTFSSLATQRQSLSLPCLSLNRRFHSSNDTLVKFQVASPQEYGRCSAGTMVLVPLTQSLLWQNSAPSRPGPCRGGRPPPVPSEKGCTCETFEMTCVRIRSCGEGTGARSPTLQEPAPIRRARLVSARSAATTYLAASKHAVFPKRTSSRRHGDFDSAVHGNQEHVPDQRRLPDAARCREQRAARRRGVARPARSPQVGPRRGSQVREHA